MRPSKILDGDLGTFEAKIAVGEEQQMVYTESDEGPFYLSPSEREAKKRNRNTGRTITKKRRKAELQDDLKAKGINSRGTLIEIQKLCEENSIAIDMNHEVVEEGWLNKPKGALQILWERGFIDPQRAKDEYTMKGKKDAFGILIPGTSIEEMMNLQSDFLNEETLLQYHGRMLGVIVDRTPKCHPEMAGEGIEYAWGCSKQVYRHFPISQKRSKAKFIESVQKALSREVLSTYRMRMFSRRARKYMLAYKSIQEQQQEQNNNNTQQKVSHSIIEQVMKKYKSHRSAADFDVGYISAIVAKMRTM